MSFSEQTLRVLEFARVRAMLTQHVSFSASRELAENLSPTNDGATVAQALALTAEALRLFELRPSVTIGGARDVRPAAQHAARGGMLDGSTLLEVRITLQSMREFRETLYKLDADELPLLINYMAQMPYLPTLEETITRAIGDDGGVLDSASPALGRLRADMRIAEIRLHERLQSMVSKLHADGSLQDAIITVRNGRYVLPVKAAQRKTVRGLVHDQSASGSTLYVEPLAIVEMNNRWREIQITEANEVARILADLSGRVGAEAGPIVAGVSALAEVDLSMAKAKLAQRMRAVQPELTSPRNQTASPLRFVNARHPLLNPDTVVPSTVYFGGSEARFLLITGPNTGGKTVVLKTVGLLSLMAHAGLFLPADEARLPIFARVFADIGDEQSIAQSLSTFSGHLTTIIRFLREIDEVNAEDPTLVLMDEVGAGTEPGEGAAIARSIIERLLERGCFGIATTHYAELKAFAHTTPGISNASVEFDSVTLAPTYRLQIGLPGRSNALAIAARLGFMPDMVERARSLLSNDEAHLEDLLADVHTKQEEAGGALERAEQIRADAEKYRERLMQELRALQVERQQRITAAAESFDDELRSLRRELRQALDEARTSGNRQALTQVEKSFEQVQSETRQKARQAMQAVDPAMQAVSATPAPWAPEVGERVQVLSVGLFGEIVSIDAEERNAQVQVGGFRMQTSFDDLKPDERTRNERKRAQNERSVATPAAVSTTGMTLDMRGWRAAEVEEGLDRYLNDAYLAGHPYVRIIHGRGGGVLRQMVSTTLKGHPLVASFKFENTSGGDGVTVARMTER